MIIAGLNNLIINYIKAINEEKYTRITINVDRDGHLYPWISNKFNYLGKLIANLNNCREIEAVLFSGSKHLKYTDAISISINRRSQRTLIMHVSKNEDLWKLDSLNTGDTTIEKTFIDNSYLPQVYLWSFVFTY